MGNPSKPQCVCVQVRGHPVNLVSLLPGSMDPAPTIGSTCQAGLADRYPAFGKWKEKVPVDGCTIQRVMLLCSVNPGPTDAKQGGLPWAWPSACLESCLQWGQYSWSESRLEVAKVHSTHTLNQAWVSTLQPSAPRDGSPSSPPIPPGNSKRERIHSTRKGWTQVWAVVSSKPKPWPVDTNSLPSAVKKIAHYYQKELLTTKPLTQERCIQISRRTG